MRRRHSLRSLVALLMLSLASVASTGAVSAQPRANFLSTAEGWYQGTVYRAVTGSLASRPAAPASSDRQDRGDRLEELLRSVEAQRNHRPEQPVVVALSVTSTTNTWNIEVRHPDDQLGLPLPSLVMIGVPKDQAALSPCGLFGMPQGGWNALAIDGPNAVTVYLFQADASESSQFQISVRAAGRDVEFVMWRIDRDGHRAMAWMGLLSRQQ